MIRILQRRLMYTELQGKTSTLTRLFHNNLCLKIIMEQTRNSALT